LLKPSFTRKRSLMIQKRFLKVLNLKSIKLEYAILRKITILIYKFKHLQLWSIYVKNELQYEGAALSFPVSFEEWFELASLSCIFKFLLVNFSTEISKKLKSYLSKNDKLLISTVSIQNATLNGSLKIFYFFAEIATIPQAHFDKTAVKNQFRSCLKAIGTATT
ncbi:hypothetical protein BpHYR1_035340, partial [Brachionus plicatilis]